MVRKMSYTPSSAPYPTWPSLQESQAEGQVLHQEYCLIRGLLRQMPGKQKLNDLRLWGLN